MTVKETRGDKLTLGIDDLCAFTDAVCGIADKCDTAAGNCNIGVVEDFMRADVYETRIANDRLCGFLPIATSESVREHSQSWVLQNLNIKSSFLSFIKNNTTEKRCVF